jgi:cytochrome P450
MSGSPNAPQAVPGSDQPAGRRDAFPLGADVTLRDLDINPHPLLRRLRAREPVSWLPALGGWLVTSRAEALRVLRDSRTFTVDDPRFSTARVIGPSMLSLDGAEHKRHRDPFAEAFRRAEVQGRLERSVEAEAERLVCGFAPAGHAELRRNLAGPLAVSAVAEVLGLGQTDPQTVLTWYDEIVAAVSSLAGQSGSPAAPTTPGADRASHADAGSGVGARAFGLLSDRLQEVIGGGSGSSLLADAAGHGLLQSSEVVSNAAVLMFGGIETTEGMICNAVWHLLGQPGALREVAADPALAANAVEESLRLEPAAAVVDRYATVGVSLAGASIQPGDLVTISLAGAGRDPAFFAEPDRFDVHRDNARHSLAFAHGPHFCLGAHLARIEARAALLALLQRLPGLRLDPARPSAPRGVVFRKPPALHVLWD